MEVVGRKNVIKNTVDQHEHKGSLYVYLFALLVVISILKTILASKKKPKFSYKSYTDSMPLVRWISFVKLPVVDGFIFLYKLRKDGVKMMENIAEKYGRNFKLNIGFGTYALVSDPTLIQKLLNSTSPGHLEKNQFVYTQLLTDVLKDGLIASKVGTWQNHRKVLSPAFKYRSIKTYFKFINNEVKMLTQSATSMALSKNGVLTNQKMKELIDHHALEIITHIIIGCGSLSYTDEERIKFHQSFNRLKDITVERFQRPELLIPFIWWLHPMRRELEHLATYFVSLSNQVSTEYRNKAIDADKPFEEANLSKKYSEKCKEGDHKMEDACGDKPFECLVELMVKSRFSNKEIADEVATIASAGNETVKVAIDMLAFQLASNPEHQKKCQMEIDNLFNSKTDSVDCNLEMEDFSQLAYLKMCILESLRLTPTVPFFIRELQDHLKLDENSAVPTGDRIFVVPWILHRDPEIYPDPETFDPNRFLPENMKQRQPHTFIPFSLGARNCIGWKIALLEINVIMAWILRHFDLHTTDGPNDVKMLFHITLKPERPYNVTFTKRVID